MGSYRPDQQSAEHMAAGAPGAGDRLGATQAPQHRKGATVRCAHPCAEHTQARTGAPAAAEGRQGPRTLTRPLGLASLCPPLLHGKSSELAHKQGCGGVFWSEAGALHHDLSKEGVTAPLGRRSGRSVLHSLALEPSSSCSIETLFPRTSTSSSCRTAVAAP